MVSRGPAGAPSSSGCCACARSSRRGAVPARAARARGPAGLRAPEGLRARSNVVTENKAGNKQRNYVCMNFIT